MDTSTGAYRGRKDQVIRAPELDTRGNLDNKG